MSDANHALIESGEPLARVSDASEYRDGLRRYRGGGWDEERWSSFRLRHGIYGQRQAGVQMIRIKIPGGVVPLSWLSVLAGLTRDFAQGPAHITTRQDIQLYHIPLERTADALDRLNAGGMTSREAGGNTVRNINACALAGACPRERVDAGEVASRLSRLWLRHPLVQAMPRKMKMTVSGCATDCGGATINDLGLIAVEKNGRPGFRALVGGGLGAVPGIAIELADFVVEEDVPALFEAVIRLHIRHSTRTERARARLRFTIKRLGAEAFLAQFRTEFDRLRGLTQRAWPPLDWRRPTETDSGPLAPDGRVTAPDGTVAAIVPVPLGQLSADQLDGLAAIAERFGAAQARLTREQNLVLLGLAPDALAGLAEALAAIGLDSPEAGAAKASVVTCPGITTCRIGINNSRAFGHKLVEDIAAEPDEDHAPVLIRVSGCHNSCSLHHAAEIGLHGLTKTVNGRPAPHYRLHLGGDVRNGAFAVEGPIVPAKLADRAVTLLRRALKDDRTPGESVRDWAVRLGPDGIARLLEPLAATAPAEDWFVDWGETRPFTGPPRATGECAAPQAPTAHLGDLALDALANFDRFLAAGRWPEALKAGEEASVLAIRRLLVAHGIAVADTDEAETVFARFRASPAATPRFIEAFDSVLAERTSALVTGSAQFYRDALSWLLESTLNPSGRTV
ncbi:nitrite/sulfite reductase [Magnetospirillum fulvum]|uniref:Sulfite reductase (NADPH) hemoprotein beta-component n=1 Tax=Magnetospirillum fulvum TaxID=1082 RepID=A0A1H6HJP1_MAGFU|nr:nitrite/sulfite reductase [Magnetospirillum fulvum]SEH34454.1 sulfite reductase (NADPH) hemoprotein beta-component [Magnetospirillum fulvum]